MMRRFALALLLVGGLLAGLDARGQTAFDLDAYRRFVSATSTMSADELGYQYPAGVFARSVGKSSSGVRYFDSIDNVFKLTADERSLIDRHGFMVTERQSFTSFEEPFRQIYHGDLPVFISTDAILHAVHISYDQILKDLEAEVLFHALDSLLVKMHAQVPGLDARYAGNARMRVPLRDLDLYITVARSLLAGDRVKGIYPEVEPRVVELLKSVEARNATFDTIFSSTPRMIDYSQFTPRGHYTETPALTQYFQAMIWLGRTEMWLDSLKGAASGGTAEDYTRQAVLSALVADAAGTPAAKALFDRIEVAIHGMVGSSDNVTLPQLRGVLQESGIASADQLLDPARLEAFRAMLRTKPFAGQRINSQILMSDPLSGDKITPPSAFLLFGQRFTVDSYVMGSVVYDKVISTNGNNRRMLPSSLDVLFALGNNAAGQLLTPELKQYGYAPSLAALRYLVDGYDPSFWKESIYNGWLGSIRTLNAPTDRSRLPKFMQTAAWWQQKMNTQLASWAQLRHDNLLYVKQSYSVWPTCSFPSSLVEPIPDFYRAISELSRTARTNFASVDFGSGRMATRVMNYLDGLGSVADTLAGIADKELAGTENSQAEKDFLCRMLYSVSKGCFTEFDGWYAQIFYRGYEDLAKEDMVVADVHTAPADADGNQVGWVLHAGTGPVNLAVVTCEMPNGETMAFVGPVMSYYEHLTTNFKRLTDEEWKTAYAMAPSLRPDWTDIYLADTSGRAKGPTISLALAGVEEAPVAAQSAGIRLLPSHPNPTTGETSISFTIPTGAPVLPTEVGVLDAAGNLVASLLSARLGGGNYTVRWDGANASGAPAPDGAYFYRLRVGSALLTGKLSLVRAQR